MTSHVTFQVAFEGECSFTVHIWALKRSFTSVAPQMSIKLAKIKSIMTAYVASCHVLVSTNEDLLVAVYIDGPGHHGEEDIVL